MADVFVSYSRRDTAFVRRMATSIEAQGKTVWIDTDGIADTEVFPQAIRSAIEGSDALIFVISPSSVASEFCEQEVELAHARAKRIVPVLALEVPDGQIPEEIRHRNWIPFTDESDYQSSIDRVVRALDTDLELRKEHTRLLVKAIEWDSNGRDRSFLLRGSELKAAEAWLATCGPDSDPAPTVLHNEYVLASRRNAARRQGALVVASVVVAVVALGLGALALVSRNQAVRTGKADDAQALSADSENAIAADPLVSVLLARQAVETLPNLSSVGALRQAIDASAVRSALPTASGATCGFTGGPSIAFSPSGTRLAESLCSGEVVVLNRVDGHVVYRRHLASGSGAVAYDPDGGQLAVGTNKGVDILDPSTGVVRSQLTGRGQPNALAFSPNGSLLAATTNLGTTVWSLPSETLRYQWPGENDNHTLAFTADGQSLVVGTGAGFSSVFDMADGQKIQELTPPAGQPLALGSINPAAVGGDIVAVAVGVTGPGDVTAKVDLWSTKTWKFLSVLTTVTSTSVGNIAVSADGRKVAVGNSDGTGGVWSVQPDEELVSLRGQTAEINSIAFSPDGTQVAAVAEDGTGRTYRASGPWIRTLPTQLCGCGNEVGWQSNKMVVMARTGSDIELQTWLHDGSQLLPGSPVVSTDQQNTGVVVSVNGRLAATWNETTPTTTVKVSDTTNGQLVFTLPAVDIENVTFSNDGRYLVVSDAHGGLHVANLATHRIVVGHGWPPGACSEGGDPPAVSANDKLVATFTFCGQVAVGHMDKARPFETFNQHQELSEIAFNPAGNRLALASWDSSATVVNVATDQPILELVGHTRGITGIAYASQGGYIVTTSADDTMRVWDANSGQLLQVDPDTSSVGDPSVSTNGRLVADENSEGQVRVWAVCPDCRAPSALLAASNKSVVTPLTPLEREQTELRK